MRRIKGYQSRKGQSTPFSMRALIDEEHPFQIKLKNLLYCAYPILVEHVTDLLHRIHSHNSK